MERRKVAKCWMLSGAFLVLAVLLCCSFLELWKTSRCLATISGCGSLMLGMFAAVSLHLSSLTPADSHTFKTLILQYLFRNILLLFGIKSFEEFTNITQNIKQKQQDILKSILTSNSDTAIGQNLSFNSIKNRVDYQKKVPLTYYENLEKYIKKIEKGCQNILTKERVEFLATTSGTTGKNKILPITPFFKNSMGKKIGSIMFMMLYKKLNIGLGRIFNIAYKSKVHISSGGLKVGPITHHMARPIPFLLSPQEVSDITDERVALYCHAIFGLRDRDVEFFEGMMAPLVYSFWRIVQCNWQDMCDDIEHGYISIRGLTPKVRAKLELQLTPDSERAFELRTAFRQNFRGVALRVWPRLKCVRMLTTGGFITHATILNDFYMKGITQVSQIHAATEGFVGLNLKPEDKKQQYALVPHYAFLEFIREDDCYKAEPDTLFIEELELGGRYEIVLTTPMGLHRYRLGDVIEITDFFNQCPIYKFQYRLGQCLNIYWEKTPENVFYEAIRRTVDGFGYDVTLVDYTAMEDIIMEDTQDEIKRYIVFMEVEKNGEDFMLTPEKKAKFDQNLCMLFEMYQNFRAVNSIGAMKIIQVKGGTFMELKYKMIGDNMNQQFKMPRVLRKPQLIQHLLQNQLY